MSERELYVYLALAVLALAVALFAALSKDPIDALTWRIRRAWKLRRNARRARDRRGFVGEIRKGAP